MKVHLPILGAFILLSVSGRATPTATPDRPPDLPGLALELRMEKSAWEQGEPIHARLRFTDSGNQPVKIGTMVASLSGRISGITFHATDANKKPVRDPFADETFAWTRSPSITFLDVTAAKPCEIPIVINDWVALAEPGRYSVIAETTIADLAENWIFPRSYGPHVTIASAPVQLEILPCPEAHRLEQLKKAERDIASPDAATRGEALRNLRYLLDNRAIPLLIQGLEDPAFQNRRSAYAGLVAFPDLKPVQRALIEKLDRDGPRLLPAAKSGYAQLLTAADSQEHSASPNRRIINGTTDKWSNYVGEKMSADLENLSPAKVVQRLYQMDTFGGGWKSLTTAQKRLVIQFANTLSDTAWFFEGTPQNVNEINSYWTACFIDYRCKDPALIPDLSRLAANEKVSPQIRMAAYKVVGEINPDPISRITDADPSRRKDVGVMFPEAPTAGHEDQAWEIRFSSFRGGSLSVGTNVIPGVECEQIVTRQGQAAPERTVRYSVGLEMGQHLEFWNFSVPHRAGENVTVKYRVSIFETDLPPQRNWSPRDGGYFKVLWKHEFTPSFK